MNREAVLLGISCFLGGIVLGIALTWLALRPGPSVENPGVEQERPRTELIKQALAAIDEDPKDVQAMRQLAGAYFNAGNHQDASDWYGRVLVLDPGDVESLLNRGYCQWKLGKPAEAMDAFRLAGRTAPEDFRAWFNMALVLSDLGKPQEARAALDRAARLNPGHPSLKALEDRIRSAEGG